MKTFLVKIYAYYYKIEFKITCNELPLDIENAIIDKLGKNDIIWEDEGFYTPNRKYITYEEVIDGENDATSTRPVSQEKRSGSGVGAGAS